MSCTRLITILKSSKELKSILYLFLGAVITIFVTHFYDSCSESKYYVLENAILLNYVDSTFQGQDSSVAYLIVRNGGSRALQNVNIVCNSSEDYTVIFSSSVSANFYVNGNRIAIPLINVKETIVIPFQADTLVRYVNSYDDIRAIQIEESEAKDLLMKNGFKPVRTLISKCEFLRLN